MADRSPSECVVSSSRILCHELPGRLARLRPPPFSSARPPPILSAYPPPFYVSMSTAIFAAVPVSTLRSESAGQQRRLEPRPEPHAR
eukprot:3774198-Rhodomonas_salina.1